MSVPDPAQRPRLLLVGGGHSHAVVLRKLALEPLSRARVTLIAAAVHTPYSGMLPGMIAGHYGFDAAHIDLEPLARAAGVQLIRDAVTGLDPQSRQLFFSERPPLSYEILSLDVGSTPSMDAIPGAREHALPVKPIASFLPRWEGLRRRILEGDTPVELAVVGAGAGGVELILAAQYRLAADLARRGRPVNSLSLSMFFGSEEILSTHPPTVRKSLTRVLRSRGVTLHPGTRIAAVEPSALVADDGSRHRADEVFWVTQAGAAPWLARSGLATDPAGFVAVDECLRSVSHPEVFAAGDVAAVLPHPREKAGVFAVRQGPPLARNLRLALAGKDPLPFEPQRRFLTIISTGNRSAVASRGSWAVSGRLMWHWKDWIDRRFMALFSRLPRPPADASDARPLVQAPAAQQPPGEHSHSASFLLRAPLEDPWMFGRIAATHAVGDLLARGLLPRRAILRPVCPQPNGAQTRESLAQIRAGAAAVLSHHGVEWAWEPCSVGDEISLGLTLEGSSPATGSAPEPLAVGDALLLSKPLGFGLILEGAQRGAAKGRWVLAALTSMDRSLEDAVDVATAHRAKAMTAVNQRGLGRALLTLLDGSALGARLSLDGLPLADGALQLARTREPSVIPERTSANARAIAGEIPPDPTGSDRALELGRLLAEPELSGGLLLAVPDHRAEDCLTELRRRGDGEAAIVGRVLRLPSHGATVILEGPGSATPS